MTKPSSIHPTLKAALNSLELEIEAEIERYQNQTSPQEHKITPKPTITEAPHQSWLSPITEASVIVIEQTSSIEVKPTNHVQTTPLLFPSTPKNQPQNLIDVFKSPFGLASVLITILGSSLLGMGLTQSPSLNENSTINKTISTAEIINGLNLAEPEIQLNLKNISSLPISEGKISDKKP